MAHFWSLLSEVRRPGKKKGCFSNCRGVSVSSSTGNMTFCDINNKRIQVLNENGEYLLSWHPKVNRSVLCPLDVSRYNEEVLMCAMEGHATLWKCPDIKNLTETSISLCHSFGNDHLVFPRNIIRNDIGQIFVSDVGKHCVNQYDVNGTLLNAIGTFGTMDEGNFNWPYYTCIDEFGRLAVADSHNRCIKLFDMKTLRYLSNFGKDYFTCATGLIYEKESSSFYVNDYDDQKLLRFTSSGKFIEYLDDCLPVAGSDVALTKERNVLVTIYDGYRVYKRNST